MKDLLQSEHVEIDNIVGGLLNGKIEWGDGLTALRESLVKHMYWEEEQLFKEVQNQVDPRMIRGLYAEHGSIIRLLNSVVSSVRIGEQGEAVSKLEALRRVLTGHNSNEDEGIYNVLNSLPKDVMDRLLAERGNPPPDWQCAVLRGRWASETK
ncbi:MAG: hemerythrin domain-containing protein [Thermoprotei archaeon]